MASSASAQSGFRGFVWASSTAYAMVARPTGTPRACAAKMIAGPGTVHSPPDGTELNDGADEPAAGRLAASVWSVRTNTYESRAPLSS